MKKLFDFKCPDGHITEHLTESDVKELECGCGLVARRVITPVRSVLPANAGFPGRDMRWIRDHETHNGKRKSPIA